MGSTIAARVGLLAVVLLAACRPEQGDTGARDDPSERSADTGPDGDLLGPVDAGTDAEQPGEDAAADASDASGPGPFPSGCEPWDSVLGAELLARLHARLHASYAPIDPQPDLGGQLNRYTTARHVMFTKVERFAPAPGAEPGVECVYTGRFVATGSDEEPDDDDVNAEHTWPRSRMDPDRDGALYAHQQSDIHTLYPSDASANSARGSLPYGEPVSDVEDDWQPAARGLNAEGETVFRPRSARRGDLARALFYFSARWGASIEAPEEGVLRRWAETDPVDDRERTRNDAIASHQGNRNPFVDCEELVERVPDFASFPSLDGDLALP